MAQSSRLIYQVAVGNVPDFYWDCIRSVKRYADACGCAHKVQTRPALRITPVDSKRSKNALKLGYLPIYEKENAFGHLRRFDQVLIVDADVYIRPDAPDIFMESEEPFAGIVERDMPLTVQYREKVRKHSEGQFSNLDGDWKWDERGAEYFNMGVMLLNKSILPWLHGETPKEFIRRPEFERFVNGEGHWRWSTDQTLLNWWLKDAQIPCQHLDWHYNGMFGANPQALDADFIHFFLSAKLPRKGAEIPDIIRRL